MFFYIKNIINNVAPFILHILNTHNNQISFNFTHTLTGFSINLSVRCDVAETPRSYMKIINNASLYMRLLTIFVLMWILALIAQAHIHITGISYQKIFSIHLVRPSTIFVCFNISKLLFHLAISFSILLTVRKKKSSFFH